MTSLNKVALIGHIGKNVELRYLPNGDGVASFSLATTEKWVDKQTGEKKEKTEWHQITAFKKLAELCGHFLQKGSMIYCEGKLNTQKYTDKDGIEKYSTKIIIDEMKMLDKKEQRGVSDDIYKNQENERVTNTQPNAPQLAPSFDDDDIPF